MLDLVLHRSRSLIVRTAGELPMSSFHKHHEAVDCGWPHQLILMSQPCIFMHALGPGLCRTVQEVETKHAEQHIRS